MEKQYVKVAKISITVKKLWCKKVVMEETEHVIYKTLLIKHKEI
tara:strand:+ start:764 stop:895 length:132 start_codon:yes stop_codon:yes gene_type:complete